MYARNTVSVLTEEAKKLRSSFFASTVQNEAGWFLYPVLQKMEYFSQIGKNRNDVHPHNEGG